MICRGGTWLHSYSYQSPFALAMFLSAAAFYVLRAAHPIDRAMAVLLIMTALMFLAKATATVVFGSGQTARITSTPIMRLISQSSTGVFVVLIGLMLLSVFVLEIMAQERSNSEVEPCTRFSIARFRQSL